MTKRHDDPAENKCSLFVLAVGDLFKTVDQVGQIMGRIYAKSKKNVLLNMEHCVKEKNDFLWREWNILLRRKIPEGSLMSGTTRTSLHRHSKPFPKLHKHADMPAGKVGLNKTELKRDKTPKNEIQSRAVSQQRLIVRLCFLLQIMLV